MTSGRTVASALLQRAARCVEQGFITEAAASACTTSGRPWPGPPAEDGASTSPRLPPPRPHDSLRALSPMGASTSAPASASSSSSSSIRTTFSSRSFASSSAAARSAAFQPSPPRHAAAQSLSQAAPGADGATLVARGQLLDSLAACLGLQHLDALLAREEHKALIDEMLLLQALDVAFRLCSSGSAAAMPQLGAGLQDLLPGQQQQQQQQQQQALKSGADAASEVLTRLSEAFIQLLSTPGGLSPEGAVKALRTLAVLRFNPAGDYAGLQTVSAYYRDVVVPALNPDPASGCPPELAVRSPALLTDLFFAFARLFEMAARRERELQAQLQAAALAEEEAAARLEDDEEAAGDGGGAGSSGGGKGGLPPWQRVPLQLPEALLGGAGTVVGDRQLYEQISHLLHGPGNPLQLLPSKSLGALATAMATSRFMHYPLAMGLAHTVVVRLQTSAPAVAPPGALELGGVGLQDRADAIPASTLSNILSCLTKAGFEAEALCDAAANWMMRHMGRPGAGPGGAGHTAVAPHHIVDVAVAFARVKYDNYDFLDRAADALMPKLPQSSPNAVSMMVWAVANCKAGRSPRFEPLLSALSQRLVAMHRNSRKSAAPATAADAGSGTGSSTGGGGGAQVVPRHLATAVFAMGRLGLLQPLLMDCVAGDVVARPDSYSSRQLANVLRAFTLLDCYRPDMFEVACGVLRARMAAQAAQAAQAGLLPGAAELQVPGPLVFSPQNYADIAWSVALAGHAPQARGGGAGGQAGMHSSCSRLAPELMELLADRVTEVAPRLGKACLVRAAQAFAVAGITQPSLYEAVTESARPLLADLGPAYLATLADAVAEVAVPVGEPFWLACMQSAAAKVDHLQRPRPDMQSAAARLLRAFRRHPATAAFASTRDHYVMPQLEQLLAQPAAF
ncbi:hypothetical protein HXX76_004354 [Chlamydomonas incerta]|uniref:Uncharacterized protein n=1 Tax=Chlamydomonas incerta TaxID=51695 RepID=A0A835T7A6_CHLIN|nr:hypothetical protein HXX76_004354 [Chlamydomonas incerta]|eukprot:KAG2440242.1 hypothetical protein HXX76_004354 [Chlamydomonas incerta]